MNILKNWKVIVAFGLVFAAGFTTSSVWTYVRFKHGFDGAFTVANWNATTMKFLQKELELTPAEEPKVRAVVEESGRQMGQTFSQAARVSGTNLVASWQQIDPLLTPAQRAIYHRKCDDFRGLVKGCLDLDLPPAAWPKESK